MRVLIQDPQISLSKAIRNIYSVLRFDDLLAKFTRYNRGAPPPPPRPLPSYRGRSEEDDKTREDKKLYALLEVM